MSIWIDLEDRVVSRDFITDWANRFCTRGVLDSGGKKEVADLCKELGYKIEEE